jgi:hypothetical protein
MKRIENASFGLTSPLPFLSRRGTPSPLRACCMFRAAIRPSRQRSTVRYVRPSQADLDICTGRSCQRTRVSGSGRHSFHWLIVFLVSCEVLFTIAAYDPDCDPFRYLRVHLRAGARWTRFFRMVPCVGFSWRYDPGREIRCRLSSIHLL